MKSGGEIVFKNTIKEGRDKQGRDYLKVTRFRDNDKAYLVSKLSLVVDKLFVQEPNMFTKEGRRRMSTSVDIIKKLSWIKGDDNFKITKNGDLKILNKEVISFIKDHLHEFGLEIKDDVKEDAIKPYSQYSESSRKRIEAAERFPHWKKSFSYNGPGRE